MSGKGIEREEPEVRTVGELIAELAKLPPTAFVMAYEGEDIGLTITAPDDRYWFIRTLGDDDDDD